MARFAQLAVASAQQAVADGGLDMEREDPLRCGVIVSSGIGGLPITVEEGLTWEVAREKELLQDVQLKPGAAALLSWLKTEGVAVVLATSSVRERAVEVLTRLGVVQYFDDMVFGTEIERGKPWPDIFLKAAEKAHAAPADCLVLEDSEAGIQAAHAAGIDVLCVPDMKMPAESYQQMTAAMLKSLDDVKGWLTAE